jgi:hypothetical protein
MKYSEIYALIVKIVFWGILSALPAYAQKDTAQLRIWQEEARLYFENEGEMYYKNLGDDATIAKWLSNHIRLDYKKLPYKTRIIGVDSNKKAHIDWVKSNNEIRDGVIWVHIVVNQEGKPCRIEYLKKSFPVFEKALHDILLIMPFRHSVQPFRDYFLAVAFLCIDEGCWSVKVS